jgi:hypothetical protein
MSTIQIIPLIPRKEAAAEEPAAVSAPVPEKRIPWDLFLRTKSRFTGESSPMTVLQFVAERGSWSPFPSRDWGQFVASKPTDCRSLEKLLLEGLVVRRGHMIHPTSLLAETYRIARERYASSHRPDERILDSADPDHPMYREKPRPGWRSIYDEPAPALE